MLLYLIILDEMRFDFYA